MSAALNPRNVVVAALLAILALLPVYAALTGNTFALSLFTRIVIFAIAAVSLNLIMGFGGMVSFGHAVYLGIGGYVVGILAKEGVGSGFVQWPLALVLSGLFALVVGALSLRTRGVYFIMITLAFAQMAYYLVLSLRVLGSDDGLTLGARPSLGLLDLNRDATFYYVALAILLAALLAMRALLNAPLGRALQGIRDNETRMEAIGFPTYRLKLLVFVVAGAAAGLGGGLLASLNGLVGPNLLNWTQSGLLMIMVILGGAGRLLGGALGAVVLLCAEEAIAEHTIHWPLGIGVVLLAVVLFAPEGLSGLMRRHRAGT